MRTGQTEGSVDLARLAGCAPRGVICEIMNDDGTMARMPDLERFAGKHGLIILTVADLIHYRLQTERLVRKLVERPSGSTRPAASGRPSVYEILSEPRQFFALVKGTVDERARPLPRPLRLAVGDLFSSTPVDGGSNLREAIAAIEKAGAGVVLYIPPKGDLVHELDAIRGQRAPRPTASAGGGAQPWTLREFGLGAQVLADLGVQQIRLLDEQPAQNRRA